MSKKSLELTKTSLLYELALVLVLKTTNSKWLQETSASVLDLTVSWSLSAAESFLDSWPIEGRMPAGAPWASNERAHGHESGVWTTMSAQHRQYLWICRSLRLPQGPRPCEALTPGYTHTHTHTPTWMHTPLNIYTPMYDSPTLSTDTECVIYEIKCFYLP